MAPSLAELVLLDGTATGKMNAWISAPLYKGTAAAATEAAVINTSFFFFSHKRFLLSCSPGYKPFSGEMLVSCQDKMAPQTAQVIVVLNQLFAKSSMQTDDFDNPGSGDLNEMEVLGSMLFYVPFSLIFKRENKRDEKGQAEHNCTFSHTLLSDSLQGPLQNVPLKDTIKMTATENSKTPLLFYVCFIHLTT